jgi:hypothetical protein
VRRLKALACLATATLAVLVAVSAAAGADGVVPVEGPWHATTLYRYPLTFEVAGGQIVNAQFAFDWGYCERAESGRIASIPVDSSGHWSWEDGGGLSAEGTFVAPNRVEGSLDTPSRMTPSCGATHVSFVATPGPLPPEPKTRVLADVRTGQLAVAPRRMILADDGRIKLFGLDWYEFGERETPAVGRALLRRCSHCRRPEVRRPPVTVRLDRRVKKGGGYVYQRIRWYFRGHVPHGFAHEGSLLLK